jgi:choline dehydrogenase
MLTDFSGFGSSVLLLRPESRGFVRIASPDSSIAPTFRFDFLLSDADKTAALAGMRAMRRIASQPALATHIHSEVTPGPDTQSDEELLSFFRAQGRSSHHPTSTCRMGTDPMAVVDPRLRVHNIQGLRVIDASIMPRIVSTNPNVPIMMIGEKGAAMILEDAHAAQ